ncbi:MAG: DUF1045 domain-containing protein [Pseudomonadota bacterium]
MSRLPMGLTAIGCDMEFRRYGIYFTPPQGAFAAFGAAWLGWDIATGRSAGPPELATLPDDWSAITAAPRKYGLHATIKPPFALNNPGTAARLATALDAFAAQMAPVQLDGLHLAPLGRFLALVPDGDSAALSHLAAETVRALDAFRAPLTEDELTRRRAAGLTPAQDRLLLEWGYPYVMEEFRFHVTLTGRLPKPALPALMQMLDAPLARVLPRPFAVDALSLTGEDTQGRFHLVHRCALSG